MNRFDTRIALLLTLGAVACASAARPRVLGQADAVSNTPAAQEAKELAPQAFAHAEKLRTQADQAYSQDDLAAAGVLAEHSIAAYEHAFVLARYVKAEDRLSRAKAALDKAQSAMAQLDEQQARLSAEADDLEMRIKVTLDKEPLGEMAETSAERLQARRDAARALTSQAQLLCLATEMLDPKHPGLAKADEDLAQLRKELEAGSTKENLFPRATLVRSSCLAQLTEVRRPKTKAAPEASATDELLTELTETQKLFAFVDDRGVVVNLRGAIEGGKPTAEGGKQLELLGRAAKSRKDFPVLVVAHTAREGSRSQAEAVAKSAADALRSAGAPEVRTAVAGSDQPVVDRHVPGAAARNERLEIIFVAPSH